LFAYICNYIYMPDKNPTNGQLLKQRFGRGESTGDRRPSACARGYGRRWQKYRAAFLKINPLCRPCDKNGELAAATIVDHIKPHKGNYDLFWDPANHQPICKRCHDKKTAIEDGGFGNARRKAQKKLESQKPKSSIINTKLRMGVDHG